jgi:hypothetical protein
MARPTKGSFHLIFEYHDGWVLVPIPKRHHQTVFFKAFMLALAPMKSRFPLNRAGDACSF